MRFISNNYMVYYYDYFTLLGDHNLIQQQNKNTILIVEMIVHFCGSWWSYILLTK
jgi:hypothetical protein